jgi:hypothetical protein
MQHCVDDRSDGSESCSNTKQVQTNSFSGKEDGQTRGMRRKFGRRRVGGRVGAAFC